MAYVSPPYDAVDFIAGSVAYTSPSYDAVDFVAPSDVPVKTIVGAGSLRNVIGSGTVTGGGKVISVLGKGKIRPVRAAGVASNQSQVIGSGMVVIKGFGGDSNTASGNGAVAIHGVGVLRDHVC